MVVRINIIVCNILGIYIILAQFILGEMSYGTHGFEG